MYCYQCEQTAKGEACTTMGVCGKNEQVAVLQDALVYALVGLAQVGLKAWNQGVRQLEAEKLVAEALFSTLTNVNFDPQRFPWIIQEAVRHREDLKKELADKGVDLSGLGKAASYQPADTLAGLEEQGRSYNLESGALSDPDPDIRSLKHVVLYGLKGVAAYADHARILGRESNDANWFLYEGLASLERRDLDLNGWIQLALKTGEANFHAMEVLDAGLNLAYGHPAPTKVPLGTRKGKAILISGHDLKDLRMLLEQTEGKGINIYTHGEMLPAHGYPELHKFEHFFGHYGTAWQNQKKEFPAFPGPVLMTTNCIQNPKGYEGNIYTTGLVGWPGIAHIRGNGEKDFGPVIQRALEMPGFTEDADRGHVTVGFGHSTVLGIADKVLDLVKQGKIRHFFLVAGCDGAKPGRNYYTEFVELVPEDCIVLTLACGKFRFFDKDLGEIDGIPRLMDVGQCNDAYSAVKIAQELANALGIGFNDLPLSMILSWYEQKAVAILLTLLYMGVKDIRLGPSLPAFLTPNVLNFLVETYNIKPITTPQEDLKAILG